MAVIVEAFAGLGIWRVSRWCFNSYIVTGDAGQLVVVDPGIPRIAEDVDQILVDIPGAVTGVTATHGHPDHIGGAPWLARRHHAQIHLPATTMSYLDGVTPRTPSVAKLVRTWRLVFGQPFDMHALTGFIRASSTIGFGTSRGMLWPAAPPTGSALVDGDALPGASQWTVITSPGHTDDHVAFWNPHTATLLSGDAILSINNRPVFAPDTIDDTDAANTRARLRALPIHALLPGHGTPIHHPWTLLTI